MIRIGIVSENRYAVSEIEHDWECISFTISPTQLSLREIFHSAFATPARYVQEIYQRLRIWGGNCPKTVFVFNPLYQFLRPHLWLTLVVVGRQSEWSGVTVIHDQDGCPIGYMFPNSIAEEEVPCLGLLSTVDARLDAELCRHLFALEVKCVEVPGVCVSRLRHNGFIYDENFQIYRWVASHALSTITGRAAAGRIGNSFAAIMPHHAGDVLFFVLAWQHAATSISSVAVNQAYQPIVVDNAAGLGAIALDIPLINRGSDFRQGKVMSEGEYFASVTPALPPDHLYFYLRPSRDYNVSKFHLIDHFAFALGRHLWCEEDLLLRRWPLPGPYNSGSETKDGVRVLLFFDGGWSLKVYTYAARRQLIELLHRNGYQITVLAGDGQEYEHCAIARFEGYSQLKELLRRQDIMVGMDSFPTHYSAHVLGLPTICLFGSTRPENSNAPRSSHYRYLEKGLTCRPCYGIVKCPLYGGGECVNFASPEKVMQAIVEMLSDVAAMQPRIADPATRYPEIHPSLVPDRRAPRRIKLDYRGVKSPLCFLAARIAPAIAFAGQIRGEFLISLRRDGWQQTYLRTLRYMRRTLRRMFRPEPDIGNSCKR